MKFGFELLYGLELSSCCFNLAWSWLLDRRLGIRWSSLVALLEKGFVIAEEKGWQFALRMDWLWLRERRYEVSWGLARKVL
jgi:hypothetical protein